MTLKRPGRFWRCPDPCGRKPCSWWEGDDPADCPSHAQVVLQPGQILPGHPAVMPVEAPLDCPLEVRLELDWRHLDQLLPWAAGRGRAWSLSLNRLVPGQDDDLSQLDRVLVRARQAGCDRVLVSLCPPEGHPPERRDLLLADRAYRYRFFGLLRSLCDEHGLKFAALELQELNDDLRFNRFFGTSKPCCRAFPPL